MKRRLASGPTFRLAQSTAPCRQLIQHARPSLHTQVFVFGPDGHMAVGSIADELLKGKHAAKEDSQGPGQQFANRLRVGRLRKRPRRPLSTAARASHLFRLALQSEDVHLPDWAHTENFI
jgi:hypothetical protein